MVVAFVKAYANGPSFSKTSDTSVAFTSGGAPLDNVAGNVLVLVVLYDNAATVGKPVVTSIQKDAAETNNWVFLGAVRHPSSTTAGAFVGGELWAIKTTVVWPGLVARYVTLDTAVTQKATHVLEFSGVEPVLRSTVGTAYSTTTTAASAATTGTTPVVGDLAIGFLFGSNVAVAQTGDTDTTGGSWSTRVGVGSTGGSGATNNFGVAQYKILTFPSHQTYNNPAAMTAGNGSIVAILQAVPDPGVTQASSRFYADGTETGSTALANQDVAPTVDVTSGDVNLGLRVRLQESLGGNVPASTDWQLQWEKNASGTWSPVIPAGLNLVDSYPSSNASSNAIPGDTSGDGMFQSFLGTGQPLTRLGVHAARVGTLTGNVQAVLYAHTGTFGTSSKGTGAPLATSTTVKAFGAFSTTATMEYFDFDGTVTLASGTPYVIGVIWTGAVVDASNGIKVSVDASSPTHQGNRTDIYNTNWGSDPSTDLIFEVYGGSGSTVVPYDSPNLTGAAATTNRLGGGTGTFQPGEVSEDGQVNDLGWSANNFTELLYSLTVKQADVANADTLKFRVLKNGATAGMTYPGAAVPTITVSKVTGPVTQQATVNLTAVSTFGAIRYAKREAAVALTAVSTLTATAEIATGAVTHDAVANLTATSTLTAVRYAVSVAAASLTATSTLVATAVRQPQASVPLTGTSTLTATGTTITPVMGSVALTATSTLTATAVRTQPASAALTGTATLTATGERQPQAVASLVATSTLTATAGVAGLVAAAAALSATSTLTATGVRTVIVGGAAVPYPTEVLADGPLLFWKLDETVGTATTADASGNGIIGSVGTAVTLGAPGLLAEPGTAGAFIAATQSSISAIGFGTRTDGADFTVEAWVKTTDAGAGQRIVAGNMGSIGATHRGALMLMDNLATFRCYNTAGATIYAATGPAINDGNPHHLVGVYSSATGTGQLYLDGAEAATVTVPGTVKGYQAFAAGNSSSGSLGFAGTIDVVAFYAAALGAGRVAAHYAAGTGTGGGAGVPLTAVSTLTSTAVRVPEASASLTATSTLTATPTRVAVVTASLTAASTLTATAVGVGMIQGSVALVTASTLTATGTRTQQATASLAAVSTLTATAVRIQGSSVSLVAASTLTANALHRAWCRTDFVHTSTLTVGAVRVPQAAVALSATSTLTASAIVTGASAAAVVLTATSTLTATAVRTQLAAVALGATSTLTVAAVRTRPGSVPLTAVSTLTATATTAGPPIQAAAVAFTATATLLVTGVRVQVISGGFTATSTLTATGVRVQQATTALTSTASLTVSVVRVPVASAGMTSTSVLTVTATVIVSGPGIQDAAHTGFLHALDTSLNWYPVVVPQ